MKFTVRQEVVTVSLKGNYLPDLSETSVKLTSTFPNWKSVGFNITTESTPNKMVYLFGVEHDDRIASIKTLFNQNEEYDKEGSFELVTPIEGYEYNSLLFNIGQINDKEVNFICFIAIIDILDTEFCQLIQSVFLLL